MRTFSFSAALAPALSFGAALMAAGTALAQDATAGLEVVGKPVDKATGFQPAATELARDIQSLDALLLWIIVPITLFVTGLMVIVMTRYNRRSNPKPASFTHNSPLEVAWTLVPIVILVVIGAFSLPVLFKQQEIPEAEITIKVTGYQWYWGYEYVNNGTPMAEGETPIAFDSFLLPREQLQASGYQDSDYLLAVDNAVVVPVNKIVVMQVTGADVIHSWAMPAFGVKQDGVPGRIAELWFKADREGVYFGQCSELCGKDHAYMPITVKVVSEAAYAQWLTGAKAQFAGLDAGAAAPVQLAAND